MIMNKLNNNDNGIRAVNFIKQYIINNHNEHVITSC